MFSQLIMMYFTKTQILIVKQTPIKRAQSLQLDMQCVRDEPI